MQSPLVVPRTLALSGNWWLYECLRPLFGSAIWPSFRFEDVGGLRSLNLNSGRTKDAVKAPWLRASLQP